MPFRMSTDNRLGVPDLQLYAVDTTPKVAVGTIIRAFDDAGVLGDAEFIYLYTASARGAQSAIAYVTAPNPVTSGLTSTTHAGTGRPIAVALTDVPAASYGWFQISGVAIVNAAAGAANESRVFASANVGQLSPTPVAGAQVLGALFTSSTGTPAASRAYVQLNRPFVQGQIT